MLNFGPRPGIVGPRHRQNRREDRLRPGVHRDGGHHDTVHHAGFPFLQTVSQRTLDNITPAFTLATGPSVDPIPLTPDAGLGQGVFSVDRDLGSGYVQQWNASIQRELSSIISIEAGGELSCRRQLQSAPGT
jgi:hypothetical protein